MDHLIFDGGGVAEFFGCLIFFPWSLTLHDIFLARHFLARYFFSSKYPLITPTMNYTYLSTYLFLSISIYLTFSLSGEGHCYRFPQLQQALLYRFVVEEVTVHNTGISLLLSTSVWVLLSPPIERRETRPTV